MTYKNTPPVYTSVYNNEVPSSSQNPLKRSRAALHASIASQSLSYLQLKASVSSAISPF